MESHGKNSGIFSMWKGFLYCQFFLDCQNIKIILCQDDKDEKVASAASWKPSRALWFQIKLPVFEFYKGSDCFAQTVSSTNGYN